MSLGHGIDSSDGEHHGREGVRSHSGRGLVLPVSDGPGYVISDMHGIATDGSGDDYGPYCDDHTGDIFANAANREP